MNQIADYRQRQKALEINRSFIIQAPAGSGKTELLVQRAIKCLLNVDNPNQVLILTFTKKASQEINERLKSYVLENEQRAQRQTETQQLLLLLDKHIQTKQWDIHQEQTLSICKTFDAFTYQLADMDINLVTHTELLYEKIVNELFYGNDYVFLKEELHHILTLINYDHEKLHQLLIDLIKTRDQWLSPLLDKRQTPDAVYQAFKLFLLNMLKKQTNPSFDALVNLSAHTLNCYSDDIQTWQMNDWYTFINQFLTKQGSWRKRYANSEIDKTVKKELNTLLSQQTTTLAELIFNLYNLPEHLPDKNLHILENLQQLLPKVCAILDMHMLDMQQCDFTFLTLKAIEQLKSEQLSNTNQYAMQIKHILIDEFQDTSVLQGILIESLLLLWEDANHRSLFIVGDPMQSIYKFRQADVRLFKQVQNEGIAHIKPESLALTCNFRSSSTLIHHFNDTFKHIFPSHDDLALGGIAYHASTPTNDLQGHVTWWDTEDQQSIINYINDVPKDETVAVLARSRSHLLPIYQQLPGHVQTPGLFYLYEYPWIQEIASILIAIFAPDAISDLAIQRLHIFDKSWHDIFNKQKHPAEITLENAINDAQKNKEHTSATDLLVPIVCAFLPNHYQHEISQYFYEQIDIMQKESIAINRQNIQYLLNNLRPEIYQARQSNIYLMTIHQSKGLEFDHVIIPSIHSRAMHDQDKLIHWFQYNPNKPMMIGNIQDKSDTVDSINQLLRKLNQKSNHYEMQRLLYVAATRAKKQLIYVGLANKQASSFAKLLKQSAIQPEELISVATQQTHSKPIADTVWTQSIQPITQRSCQAMTWHTPSKSGAFGTAIHHVLETFLSLSLPLEHADTDPRLRDLCAHYDLTFSTKRFSTLFNKLQKSNIAQWLFSDCTAQWQELTLYGPNHQILRIDYIFAKNDQLFIVDFKTNTSQIDQYTNQLIQYEHAAESYFNKKINLSLIYNPLEDFICDKYGKQFHLELIL